MAQHRKQKHDNNISLNQRTKVTDPWRAAIPDGSVDDHVMLINFRSSGGLKSF